MVRNQSQFHEHGLAACVRVLQKSIPQKETRVLADAGFFFYRVKVLFRYRNKLPIIPQSLPYYLRHYRIRVMCLKQMP